MNLANAVTALRPMLTPVLAWSIFHGVGLLAALVFAIGALSDFVDGRLARHRGTASETGRWLDHVSDIVFLLGAFAAYVAAGITPWWVPACIAIAFGCYVVDWLRLKVPAADGRRVGNRIGHFGGIANYVLLGVLIGNETLGVHVFSSGQLMILFALVPIYSALGIAARRTQR